MHTALDCVPCFARQALEAARFVSSDPACHERVLREVLRMAADMDMAQPPPAVGQQLHSFLRELTGNDDPYRGVKQRFNQMALEMLPELEAKLHREDDPLWMALRLAIAGNVIDLGVTGNITEEAARRAIANVLHEPFQGDVDAFRCSVGSARRILYLADNAGEIVFDRLLVEQLPTERVTVAVRGRPVINDATREDAQAAGLCDLVEVIDNGSDAPATLLEDCSDDFRRRFAEADLIIAKGQGNYETLSDEPAPICFLLKVKCEVIAAHIGAPVGTHILACSPQAVSLESARR